jgi:hypothetical protein
MKNKLFQIMDFEDAKPVNSKNSKKKNQNNDE